MKTLKSLMLGASLSLAMTAPGHADGLANSGFDGGDLSGWTSGPGVVVVTEASDAIVVPPYGETFTATGGQYFAQLTAGPLEGEYTMLSQAFSLTGESLLSFDAAFLAFDYMDYNDDAYVRIRSLSGDIDAFLSSVSAVGDQGHTPWTHFVSGPLAIGNYVFEAGVRNIGDPDPAYSSRLLLDSIAIAPTGSSAVPEPESWILMILGFGGLGAVVRRRRLQDARLT